jgi:hypothetical protein
MENIPMKLSVMKEAGMSPIISPSMLPRPGMDFSEALSSESVSLKFTPTQAGKYVFPLIKSCFSRKAIGRTAWRGFWKYANDVPSKEKSGIDPQVFYAHSPDFC